MADGIEGDGSKHQAEQLELRGGWAFEKSKEDTLAYQLNSSAVVHLTGELQQNLWQSPQKLLEFATLFPALAPVLAAVQEPRVPSTLLELLRGSGFGQMFVELTGRCNERCLHCYASSSPDVAAQLSKDVILSVVDEAAHLGFRTIQFTGGDPLLSPHIRAAVGRASERGFKRIEVYTNGLALKPDLASDLIGMGARFAFSMYSHLASVHDQITQTVGSFERTVRAIRMIVQSGATVRIGAVLRRENQAHGVSLREFLEQLGVPSQNIRITIERPVGRGTWDDKTAEESSNGNSSGGDAHQVSPADLGRGKLAVTYDGLLTPCIFDRKTTFGRVSTDSSISALLNRPIRSLKPAPTPHALSVMQTGAEQLACSGCRARRDLLGNIAWETNDGWS